MTRWVTWLLAFAALSLLGFIFLAQAPWSLIAHSPEKSGYIFRFDPTEVTALEITSPGETIRIRRESSGWEITKPLPPDRASASQVEKILYGAQNLGILDRIAAKDFSPSLDKEYGFSPPKLTLTIESAKAKWILTFGREAIGEKRVFVRSNLSANTFLVSDELQSLLLAPVGNFRDLRLVASTADRIDRISIRRSDGDIKLERDGAEWKLRRPLQARANSEKIDHFLELLLGAKIHEFLPDDSSLLASGEQKEILLWEEGEEEPIQLLVSEIEGQSQNSKMLLVKHSRRNASMLVSPTNFQLAELSLHDLRSPQILKINPDLIDRFQVVLGEEAWEFERQPEGWDFQTGEVAGKIDPAKFQQLLDLLDSEKITSFLLSAATEEQARQMTQEPTAQIFFNAWLSENTPETTAGLHPIAQLQFWHFPSNGEILVRTDEDASLRKIGTSFLSRLLAWLPPTSPKPLPLDTTNESLQQ